MPALAKPFDATFFVGLLFVLSALALASLAIGGRALRSWAPAAALSSRS